MPTWAPEDARERFVATVMHEEVRRHKVAKPYQGPTVRWSKVTRRNLNDPEPADEWVTVNGRDFVNRAEHLRLAALGLVPLDPEIAQASAPAAAVGSTPAESRVVRGPERRLMTVAEKPKAKRAWHDGLSKTALRKKLLETPTLSDGSWAAWRAEHGIEAVREKGESRETFIRRVLA